MRSTFAGTRTLLAAALAALGTAASAQPGYVTDSSGNPVTNAFGDCVHSGFWTPELAQSPCDAVPVSAAPAPVVSAEPQPAPEAKEEPLQNEPTAEAAPPPPVLEKMTLSADVLFEFNSATLKDSGKQKLDELASRVKDANVEEVNAVGHADRIGSEQYNQKLSEERAQAVTAYLQGNMNTANLQAEGRGKSEPVTGEDCKGMGPERKANRKLVECLQPDRRVDIEVLGTREAAAEPGSAGVGTSGPR
jgi:OOP family OmpA-OmpF porin